MISYKSLQSRSNRLILVWLRWPAAAVEAVAVAGEVVVAEVEVAVVAVVDGAEAMLTPFATLAGKCGSTV